MRVNIKPMTVNIAWRGGRRFKTKEYLQYEKDLLIQLKPMKIPEGELELRIDAGFSNKGSDLDNIIKPFLDILQKKYNFNDSRVYRIVATKIIVTKGNEFIEWELRGE